MNFPLILLILTVVTGIFWVLERRSFLPARKARAEEAARRFEADNREAIDRGEKAVIDARNDLYAREIRQPWWLEYTAGLFPVIAIVFFVRSFLFEPFRIPSGSMLPTLHVGDFILVNKYEYGIRLPVTNWKIIPLGSPQRGDVVVFKYPMDESV
ncbi:MAG: signal peptidase I, partial [Sutterella wadsworthensis]